MNDNHIDRVIRANQRARFALSTLRAYTMGPHKPRCLETNVARLERMLAPACVCADNEKRVALVVRRGPFARRSAS